MARNKQVQKELVFLRGRIVTLRPILRADVPLLLRWINDPDVWCYLGSYLPQNEKTEEEWVNKLDPQKDIVFGMQLKGKLIGLMGIHKINRKDQTAVTGSYIGEKKYWGKGYGTDAKMAVLEYCFNTLNLRKICSDALSFNERSIRYSLRCGYKKEGLRKEQIFKRGQYWDLVELAVFRKDWEPIWKRYKKTGNVR